MYTNSFINWIFKPLKLPRVLKIKTWKQEFRNRIQSNIIEGENLVNMQFEESDVFISMLYPDLKTLLTNKILRVQGHTATLCLILSYTHGEKDNQTMNSKSDQHEQTF